MKARARAATTFGEWVAIVGFLMVVSSGLVLAGSLELWPPPGSGSSGTSVATQVDYDTATNTTLLQINAGTNITLSGAQVGATRTITITAASGGTTFSGDVGTATQQYLNNSTATAGGAVQFRDPVEFNNATATAPTTVTATANTLTINVDGTGALVLDSSDSLTATAGTIATLGFTTATGTNLITTNATATTAFVDNVRPRSNATRTKLLNTVGWQFSNESETAATISTLSPGTNDLAINIGGTGTLTLDATDTFVAGAATISSLQYTAALGTNSITTNNTATNVFATTIRPRTFGTQNKFDNTSGWLFSDDSETSTLSMIVSGGANSTLTISPGGIGTVSISSGDVLETNTLQSTTVNGTLTIQGNTNGGVKVNSGTGYVEIAAGDTLQADSIESISANTTVTIIGRGTGGVSVGLEPFSFSSLSGTAGADAKGDMPVRDTVGGVAIYRPLAAGATSGHVLTSNGSAAIPSYQAIPSATVNVSNNNTSFGAVSSFGFNGDIFPVPATNGGGVTFATVNVTGTCPATFSTLNVSTTATSNDDTDGAFLQARSFAVSNGQVTRVLDNVSFTAKTSTAGSAINGRDQSGAFSASVWVYLHVIWGSGQPSGGLWSLSSTAPTLPTNYTHFGLASAAFTNAAGDPFSPYIQTGRRTYYNGAAGNGISGHRFITSGHATTFTEGTGLANLIPAGSREALLGIIFNPNSSGNQILLSTDAGNLSVQFQGPTAGANHYIDTWTCTSVARTIFYKGANASDTTNIDGKGWAW